MRRTLIAFTILCFSFSVTAQDVGYRTTDVGATYQYSPDFHTFSLHLGFNSEEHHSFVLKGSYISSAKQKTSSHNSESGSGFGGYLGYRYHFSVIPKRAFLGLGLGFQSMTIDWTGLLFTGNTKTSILQPTLEAGYTLVINDYMYITPSVSGIIQTKLSSKGQDVGYGSGFAPAAGISIGWRF